MIVVNRLLAFLLGLALAAGAGIAAVEVVLGLVGQPPWLLDREVAAGTAARLRWEDPGLVLVAVVLVLTGLGLVALQVVRRRPPELALTPSPAGHEATVDRRGLQERLRRVAEDDPDVRSAEVKVGRRATITARVAPDTGRAAVRDRLAESAGRSLQQLDLAAAPALKVKVEPARPR